MSKFTALDEQLHDYIVEHGAREDSVLAGVRREAEEMGDDVSVMQIAPDQGAFLTLLVRILGAERAIEVGTFTGYSAICIARGIPFDGLLVACELDPERARRATRNFADAQVADRIDLRIGPALESLDDLDSRDPFDFAFIDAEKTGYPDYYERCLELLRPGGVIVLDNVLMDRRVLDPGPEDDGARTVDSLNRRIAVDSRVTIAMVGIADGLTIVRKR